jgi:hypothetical protein
MLWERGAPWAAADWTTSIIFDGLTAPGVPARPERLFGRALPCGEAGGA